MTRQRTVTTWRSGALAVVLLATAGCGGSNGTGPTGAPVISNLVTTFVQQLCDTSGGTTSSGTPPPVPTTVTSTTGTLNRSTFSFTDPEGNLSGGVVSVVNTPDVGFPVTNVLAIPSTGVTITGVTSGTVTLSFCTRFGEVSSFTRSVRVADTAGNTSNTIVATSTRPNGAPERPRASGAGLVEALIPR